MLTSDFRNSHTLLSINDLFEVGILSYTFQVSPGRVIVVGSTLMPVKVFRGAPNGERRVVTTDDVEHLFSVDEKAFFCVYQQ